MQVVSWKRGIAVALTAGVLSGGAGWGQAAAPGEGSVSAKMQAFVGSYAKSQVRAKQFMGSVLVVQDGKTLVDQGYGSADLEWGVPDGPDTKYRLGSLTKQFTAASILLLEQRGKLSTDDLVKKYVPDAPAAWDTMTIYQVLTHTAGIPNFTEFPDYGPKMGTATTPAELVARFENKPLDFAPGAEFRYSNSGYVLLGYILEKVAGEPYAKFVQENLFGPLGMTDTGVDQTTAILPKRAQGYEGPPGKPRHAAYIDMSVPFAAGSLYSTTGDLLKWEQGLFGGKVLNAAELTKMTTPNKSDYACGLGVAALSGHKEITHGGAVNGFITSLAWFPDDKLTVVVLANLGAASGEIGEGLARIALGMPVELAPEKDVVRTEVTVPAKVLADYVGVYQLMPNLAITIALDGDHLTAASSHQPATPIFAESETKFFAKVVDVQFEFKRDAAGKVVSLTLNQSGHSITGPKN